MARRNSVTGYMTTFTPRPASVAWSSSWVLPNSVILTSNGASTELAEAFDLRRVGQGFGEYHVRPGVQVGLGPLHGRVKALDGPGVGAGTYDKGRVVRALRPPP